MKYYQTTVEPVPGQNLTVKQHAALVHGFDLSEKDPRAVLLQSYTARRVGHNQFRWVGGPQWEIEGVKYEHVIDIIEVTE